MRYRIFFNDGDKSHHIFPDPWPKPPRDIPIANIIVMSIIVFLMESDFEYYFYIVVLIDLG